MPTSSPPRCHVVLSLAHLLGHSSPSYEDEKDALLDASVRCASALAGDVGPEGEVHLVLTGSPRPTFAETNAWLLDRQASTTTTTTTPRKRRNVDLAGSYSIADNDVDMAADDAEEDAGGEGGGDDSASDDGENNLDDILAERAREPASPVAGGGEGRNDDVANTSFLRRHTFPAADGGRAGRTDGGGGGGAAAIEGPMVGRAVVNAISQAKGVGLHSSRARLLQGTIDRPDWIQTRWTDGECVFGELVSRCGLDSFENTAGGGRLAADDGGGGSSSSSSSSSEVATTTTTKVSRLRKTTNLSAHLVTVPTLAPARDGATSSRSTGTGDGTTVEEIARGVLRCLKRKGSPPAHGVYLVFPPDGGGGDGGDGGRMTTISSQLAAAFQKLERYNDMIGAPRLMADARFEFVPVSI